jgi:hypothetical protein
MFLRRGISAEAKYVKFTFKKGLQLSSNGITRNMKPWMATSRQVPLVSLPLTIKIL